MILRRPYAFLIKHFRFVHLILCILSIYLTIKASNIVNFFKDYISFNGNMEVIASNYFGNYIYLLFGGIILLSIIIYLLMKYKKKPRTLYILIILGSIISLSLFIYLYSNIKSLEVSSMSGREVRLLRDISKINYYLFFVMNIPIVVRGLGFDIKKFNFNKDLVDLNLNSSDSEEVEVNIDFSSNSVKRGFRRYFRELKYYYKENKIFINIILVIVGLIIIMVFPVNRYVINGNIGENELLRSDYIDIMVKDSYISDRNRISKNNSYVIVKFIIKGNVSNYKLDLDDFVLKSDNNKYIPSMKYYYYFDDIGSGYRGNVIGTDKYYEYIFVYNINSSDKNSKFVLDYFDSNRNIKLSPDMLD